MVARENAILITIADDDYDCRAPDSSWQFGLYLDPEGRTVRHWSMHGPGSPLLVWHNRAIIAGLARGSVGERVAAIVKSDKFRDLVEELFALYKGSVWDGSNHLGQWDRGGEYEDRRQEIVEKIEALFKHVATYWDAGDWLASGGWGEHEARGLKERVTKGETLQSIADDYVANAHSLDAYIDADEVKDCIESLLEKYADDSDDE